MSGYENSGFRIPRHTDEQVIRALLAALSTASFVPGKLDFHPMTGGETVSVAAEKFERDEKVRQYLSHGEALFKRVFVHFLDGRAHVRVDREPDALSDRCTLELSALNNLPHQHPPIVRPEALQLSVLSLALRRELKELLLQDMKNVLGEQLALHYERRENELSEFQETLLKVSKTFTEGAADHASKLRDELRADREQLKREFEDKNRIEAERVAASATALKSREEELAAKQTEFNDRDARHSRRKIREDLKAELAKRSETFALTEGTRKLRGPITVACLGLGVTAATILAILVQSTAMTPALRNEPLTLIRIVAAGLTLAGTAVFYLRWQNRWFEQHAREEFRLKRMALDIDRASWVVELAMEWKHEKGTELPKELLDRLTAQLFAESEKKEEPLHPADQLASALFGASAGATLKLPNGSEVRMDRKSVRDLEKEDR